MKNGRRSVLVAALATLIFGGAVMAGEAKSAGVLYQLLPAASFQEGCTPPCMCPAIIIPGLHLEGSFRLLKDSSSAKLKSYRLRNISWRVVNDLNQEMLHTITGDGTYTRWPMNSNHEKHQLTLNISIDGGNPVSLDSGQIIGCAEFPNIAISVVHQAPCFYQSIDVVAGPRPAAAQNPDLESK